MPELTINISISPADLATLVELPQQIVTLATDARTGIEAVLAGGAAGNPLSGLLGTLGTVAGHAGELPDLDGLVGPVRELVGRLPTAALADVATISASIDDALQIVAPLAEALRGGSMEQALQIALDRALEVSGDLLRDQSGLAEVGGELAEFFRLFGAMLEWGARPPRPEAVVELLSRALIGVAPDVFAAPAAALEAALAPLNAIVPAGPDLGAWRTIGIAQLQLWQGIDARLSGTIDWRALQADLSSAQRQLLELTALRDRLLAGVVTNLNRLELPALPSVATALLALPRIQPTQMTPIFDGMRRQLQGMVADLTSWQPTPEEVRRLVRQFIDRIVEGLLSSPLGQLRNLMITFEQRAMDAIEHLPFRALAHEAEAALRSVAETLDVLDPEAIRQPIRDFFGSIKDEIESISGDAVGDSIGQVWEQVGSALNEVATQLGTLRTTLEGLTGELQGFVGTLQPTIDAITGAVTTITDALEAFDLQGPADVVIAEFHKLRDTVAGIDVSNLPAPAVDAVKLAAEALRQIDITGAVAGPLNEALGQVDPTPLLEDAAAAIGAITEQLRALDPGTIAATLDGPVDELLATLARFDPAQLGSLIGDALEPVKAPLQALDAAVLLQPLTGLYAELIAKVDAVLNPDVIFGPLEALFQPVLDLVDAVDPGRLLDLIAPHAGDMAANVGGAAGPPAAVAQGGAMLRDALTTAVDIDDELFGFRPGDLLVPLLDLHRKLMEVFDALADDTLGPAAALLQQNFVGRLAALEPAAIGARVAGVHATLRADFDTGALSERLLDATLAYHRAAGKIHAAAQLNLGAEDRVIAAQVTVTLPDLSPQRLLPAATQQSALGAASVRATGAVALPDVRAAYARVVPNLEALLPSFLSEPNLGAAALRQALQALDPAPIRDEINALFDQVGQRLAGLQDVLMAALDEVGQAADEFLLPISPGNLLTLGTRLHAALKQQIATLGPATFKDEITLIFDSIKHQLSVLNPAVLVEELNGLRDELLAALDQLVAGLLPDGAPLHALQAQLATLKPSQLLAGLTATMQPLTELIAALDPAALLQPVIELVARIRDGLPDVIASVEAAFDEVLAAFPGGGIDRASVEVSVG